MKFILEWVKMKTHFPSKVLMVTPEYFTVEYAINPHMVDKHGKLNTVDRKKAQAQWQVLKKVFSDIGLEVIECTGEQGLPDMVFCANQTFPYLGKDKKKKALLSNMANPQRVKEVPFIEKILIEQGYSTLPLPLREPFEGMGDALWNYETKEIFCGYGFRTSKKIAEILSELTGAPVYPLKLVDNRFYHLDTCMVILKDDTAAYVPEAFDKESISLLQTKFDNLIELDLHEALHSFAGNAFCPDGKNVILQWGAPRFSEKLKELGFYVIEVDTGEYIKSGGSVFCMKLQIW